MNPQTGQASPCGAVEDAVSSSSGGTEVVHAKIQGHQAFVRESMVAWKSSAGELESESLLVAHAVSRVVEPFQTF